MNFYTPGRSMLTDSLQKDSSFDKIRPVPKRFRKWILLVLLLVAPLQGVAATLTAIVCASPPAQMQELHAGHHAGHASNQHSHQSQDQSENQHGADASQLGQFCCQGFAALPADIYISSGAEPPAFDPQYRFTSRLFYPEQPQPVPLA